MITSGDGEPILFNTTARRRTGDGWVLYVPRLMSEIRLYPNYPDYSPDMQVGTQMKVMIGLNYRGLLPWDGRRATGQVEHGGRQSSRGRGNPGPTR